MLRYRIKRHYASRRASLNRAKIAVTRAALALGVFLQLVPLESAFRQQVMSALSGVDYDPIKITLIVKTALLDESFVLRFFGDSRSNKLFQNARRAKRSDVNKEDGSFALGHVRGHSGPVQGRAANKTSGDYNTRNRDGDQSEYEYPTPTAKRHVDLDDRRKLSDPIFAPDLNVRIHSAHHVPEHRYI
jgi:hypothetical protein